MKNVRQIVCVWTRAQRHPLAAQAHAPNQKCESILALRSPYSIQSAKPMIYNNVSCACVWSLHVLLRSVRNEQNVTRFAEKLTPTMIAPYSAKYVWWNMVSVYDVGTHNHSLLYMVTSYGTPYTCTITGGCQLRQMISFETCWRHGHTCISVKLDWKWAQMHRKLLFCLRGQVIATLTPKYLELAFLFHSATGGKWSTAAPQASGFRSFKTKS